MTIVELRSGSQHEMLECPPGLQRAVIPPELECLVVKSTVSWTLDTKTEMGRCWDSLGGQILNCGTTRNGANTDSAIGSGAFVTSCAS